MLGAMKRTLLALLPILAAPALSLAEMGVENVSKARAQELGIEIRLTANGPSEGWVQLEFKATGPLKDFQHVSLEISEGDKFLLGYAPLQATREPSGRVTAGFLASRAFLDKVTLRIVTGAPRDEAGHDLRVRDLVDLAKAR
jgi:hypothetical protein